MTKTYEIKLPHRYIVLFTEVSDRHFRLLPNLEYDRLLSSGEMWEIQICWLWFSAGGTIF